MDVMAVGVFALALLLTAGMPGPSIAALVARVITHGWRNVLPFVAAMWIGEVLWLSVAMAGLSALAITFHTGFQVVKLAGIGYLIYLAWSMWHQETDGQGAVPRHHSPLAMFGAGMALTVGNPKIMVFYLALLPSLVDLSAVGLGQWAVLVPVTVLCLAVADLGWILVAHQARNFVTKPRSRRIANRISAGALGGAAMVLAGKS